MSAPPRTVILTGAGVSADSGVATFRDPQGVWAQYDHREVATPQGFAANPRLVHEFYNARRRGLPEVAPNLAHEAIARFQAEAAARGGSAILVTQNVDDLHERAGSEQVWHMHGELAKARCDGPEPGTPGCGAIHPWTDDLGLETACPACGATGGMRPHVVWFGEMPMLMEEIEAALAAADCFVSIGTSGSVYPAAGFVHAARAMGVKCVELNLEPSENAYAFDDGRYGRASDVVPAWVREVLGDS